MSYLKMLKSIGALVSYINFKRNRLSLFNLIKKGLKVGKNVYIGPNVTFDNGFPYLIEIGDNCRISSGVNILAHDATTFRDLGVTRIAPVKILHGCFIGINVIILPGITIGPRAVIAAGAVVNRDIGEGKVAAGNPARIYANYPDILTKYSDSIQSSKVFKQQDVEEGIITPNDIINSIEKYFLAFIRGVPPKDPYYINTDMVKMRKKAEKDFNSFRESLNTKTLDSND